MASFQPRRLYLHSSALSDDEYSIYIGALRDVLDVEEEGSYRMTEEDELQRMIGVREVRAWMKGRYRDVRPSDIDKILHLFSASFEAKDVLSGGQFLAAIRLLSHVQTGGEVLEGNVFVQAKIPSFPSPHNEPTFHPLQDPPSNDGPTSTSNILPKFTKNPFAGTKLPPHLPLRRSSLSHLDPRSSNPDSSEDIVGAGQPNFDTRYYPSSDAKTSNPFLQRSKTHAGTNRMVSRGSDGDSPLSSASKETLRAPPLPPGKPMHMHAPKAPPSHPTSSKGFSTSMYAAANIANGSPPKNLLPLPPPPTHPNLNSPYVSLKSTTGLVTSITPLMRQSLEASKAGSALKRAQKLADKERVLEIIQTSSKGPSRGSSADAPSSRAPPPIPTQTRRPAPSPTQSTTSTTSLERVASARVTPRVGSPDHPSSDSSVSTTHPPPGVPQQERQSPTTSTFPQRPPVHPHRRPSGHRHTSSLQQPVRGSSPITDVLDVEESPPLTIGKTSRSLSMHHTMSPMASTSSCVRASSPPAPPARKKRPESVQIGSRSSSSPFADSMVNAKVSPSQGIFSVSGSSHSHSPSSGFFTPSTQSSHSIAPTPPATASTSASSSSPLTFTAFQRAFTSIQALHSKAQPAFDRAKYKTEAGLAPRRGFVRDAYGKGGLLEDTDLGNDDDSEEDDGYAGVRTSPVTNDDLGVDVDFEGKEPYQRSSRTRYRNTSGFEKEERDNLKLPVGQLDGWTQL